MNWQAIQTLVNREERVAAELTQIKVEYYLPVFREKRRWSDREQWVNVPVFKGYLFARIDEDLALRRRVLDTPGCTRIVGLVSDAEIDAVRKMMANGARPLDPLDKMRHLPKGEPIRVKCGPLTGIEGVLLRHKGMDRMVVSLNMIHGAIATEINIRDVQLLETKKAA